MPVVVTSSNPKPRTAGELASEVARSVSKENSATARSQALTYLNHIINELNTMQPWYMLRRVGQDTAFTASEPDYTLGTDVFMVEKVQIVDATTAIPLSTVRFFDYAAQKEFDPTLSAEVLSYYTVRNLHDDNVLTFFGTPTAMEVSKYKFRVSYIQRIEQLAAADDVLDVPKEFEAPLLAGAKYYMRDMDESADSAKAAREFANYQRLVKRLKFMDKTQPDEHFRFRLGGRLSTFGTTYIRV